LNMSRISDIQGCLRGLGKIGENRFNITKREVVQIWRNPYLNAVVQQGVNLIVNSQKESDKRKNKTITFSQAADNLPLVVQGMQIFAGHILGFTSPSKFRKEDHDANINKTMVNIDDKEFIIRINPNVSALDLLDFDITNEKLLKEKIFQKIQIEKVTDNEIKSRENKKKESNKPKLSISSKEKSSVPSSRISRVASFAGLGVGLGVGVLAEASRRAVGFRKETSNAKLDGSLVLNEANAERIVATLCRVRGAALKLGQILSIQDGAVIGPELQKIFDRVRENADFMPLWQLEKVMKSELGSDWRSKFKQFENEPFAAASIGQVHYARLQNGNEVAVKVQYPGVAKSIDSDIRNLLSLISLMAFLPKGLFIESIANHMKEELAEECDYVREANCGDNMKRILAQYPEYYVPEVYVEMCSSQVLTSEYITGLTIDNCVALPQKTRNFIAESILKLVFRELFLHKYMQTDPNWANFLYNPETNKIGLLDFGATREFRPSFVNTYFKIIDCAVKKDRDGVLEYSREVGFLTGNESSLMNKAHIDSVMLLATPFHHNEEFNFGKQTITQEIQDLSGVMLKERLCPPPPEVYSLHRKLSGLFLLAGKLDSQFNCYSIWKDIRTNFRPFDVL